MELNPKDTSIQQRPSLFHVSQQVPAGNTHYSLEEKPFGHLIIRATADNKSLASALKKVTGLSLPATLSSVEKDGFIINWIAPDEFLLLVPEKTGFEIENKLRKIAKGHYAIVNVTGGQTLLELSGKQAATILMKSTSYDIHLINFPIGKVVTSVFAKSQAVMRRTGADSFQLIIRRSFSDYVWKWMVDAGSRE
jgi:sarcosine oxidase subunit gamma